MQYLSTKPNRLQIARARARAGLTQEELAVLVGCSVFSIGKYERGERSPRGPMLRRIAAATGQPLTYFFADDRKAVA